MSRFICDYCSNVENTARATWWIDEIFLCTCCVFGQRWEFHKTPLSQDIIKEDKELRGQLYVPNDRSKTNKQETYP
jgi:hypothetical protein